MNSTGFRREEGQKDAINGEYSVKYRLGCDEGGGGNYPDDYHCYPRSACVATGAPLSPRVAIQLACHDFLFELLCSS